MAEQQVAAMDFNNFSCGLRANSIPHEHHIGKYQQPVKGGSST